MLPKAVTSPQGVSGIGGKKMQTYSVYEGNMDRLKAKLVTIKNKCQKYGCEFYFAEVGEEFKERLNDDGTTSTLRYVLVEAEGKAMLNGWEFIASVEHTDNGNIFSGVSGVEIPERYYNCEPTCEHCNTVRPRKYSFIVRNTETGEFKQVGKACLKDFTNGLSASAVAIYLSYFEEIEECREPLGAFGHSDTYYETNEILRFAAECVRKFGYEKRFDGNRSTASRVQDYYNLKHGRARIDKLRDEYRREIDSVAFNENSKEVIDRVENVLSWISTQPEENTYFHNLKTACSLEYIKAKNISLVCSVFPAYEKKVASDEERAKKDDERRKQAEASSWVGNIGDRVSFKSASIECVTSWETMYGTTFIYKMIDEAGNVYTWKTSNGFACENSGGTVKGTVKEHNEYRGIKQTELTRCKFVA